MKYTLPTHYSEKHTSKSSIEIWRTMDWEASSIPPHVSPEWDIVIFAVYDVLGGMVIDDSNIKIDIDFRSSKAKPFKALTEITWASIEKPSIILQSAETLVSGHGKKYGVRKRKRNKLG